MTPPEDNEAQRLIESHIATLDQHKGQLERALAHLKGPAGGEGPNRGQGGRGQSRGGQSRQVRGSGPREGRRPRSENGGAQRAPRGARRGEVIADLEANPGSKAATVANRVGINPTHAQTILANLVKQGVATKEGQQYTAVAG
jgi:predicted transcriptional regulator